MSIDTAGMQRDQIARERDRIANEARQLLDRSGDTTLSDDDRAAYDEAMADLDALHERDERMAKLERLAGVPGAAVPGIDRNHSRHPDAGHDDLPRGRTERHTQAARLLARSGPRLGDELADKLARQVEADPAGAVAERVLVTADPHYSEAWRKVAADPTSGHRSFTTTEAEAWSRGEQYGRALDLTSGAAAVPTHLDPTVMLSSDGVNDPMRSICRVVQLTTGTTWHGVSSDGVTSRWAAENSEANDDSPALAAPEVETHKADSFVPISLEALADMSGVDSSLRQLFVEAKATHEAPAFITGDGNGRPTGLLTGLTATETVPTAAVGAFAAGDVLSLIEALPPRFRTNARWLASLGVMNVLDAFETGSGAKRFAGLDAATPTLLRKPIVEHSEISSTIATGEHILVAGDFASYVIVDRGPFAVELIPHLFGAAGLPTGQRGYYAYWRVGGAPVVANAFRRLEVA